MHIDQPAIWSSILAGTGTQTRTLVLISVSSVQSREFLNQCSLQIYQLISLIGSLSQTNY